MLYTIDNANKYENMERSVEKHFLELLSCKKHQFGEDYLWRVSPSDKYELFCVLSGGIRIRGEEKSLGKGAVALVRSCSRYDIDVEGGSVIVRIAFFASAILPILARSKDSPFFSASGSFPQINKLRQMSNNRNTVTGVKEAVLLDLLNDLNEYARASQSELLLYQRACEWIEAHSDKAISARDVATALGCSRAHLGRTIKLIGGDTLGERIAACRVARIKNMCRIEKAAVSEIASRLGFYSSELLCKFFKYHTGISISEYAKKSG